MVWDNGFKLLGVFKSAHNIIPEIKSNEMNDATVRSFISTIGLFLAALNNIIEVIK